jgi:hypothetical protein
MRIWVISAAMALLASSAAASEPQRLWAAGWGLFSGNDDRVVHAQAMLPEGSADGNLPPAFEALSGRPMYLLGKDGKSGTVTVTGISNEPSGCLPDIVLPQPLPISNRQFFLASTVPMTVALSKEIPLGDPRLAKGIAAYLALKGIKNPKVEIPRAMEVDLNGDGRLEAIVEARSSDLDIDAAAAPRADGFAIVAVGNLTGDTYAVAEHVGYIYGTENDAPSRYGIVGLPDYSGSGKFDIAVSYYGYEWTGVDVYGWTGRSLKRIASAYCGL